MNRKMMRFARAGTTPVRGAMELNAASAASEFLAARPAKAIEPNPHASFESAARRVVPKDGGWERFERISVGGRVEGDGGKTSECI